VFGWCGPDGDRDDVPDLCLIHGHPDQDSNEDGVLDRWGAPVEESPR
jgi:hypothetical protein